MWLQIVGKLRMVCTPPINHWWHVPLYVTARGLATGLVPSPHRSWDAEFDFTGHELLFRTADGGRETISLRPMTVAVFYNEVRGALERLGLDIRIHASPNEVVDAIPFADDTVHSSYDPDAVTAFWQQLVFAHDVLLEFRSRFGGKVSPVHFFWGAMDLAVTRFSGRDAPPHPGGAPNCPDHVMREGYSHELSSAGFWPGGGAEGAFYSYAYPAPKEFDEAPVPEQATFDEGLGEFILPFEFVRAAADPRRLVSDFLEATFDAASRLGGWGTQPGLEH
jgi:hypothetical protein